jgi:tetratricopeptide (TPR) repeat protein
VDLSGQIASVDDAIARQLAPASQKVRRIPRAVPALLLMLSSLTWPQPSFASSLWIEDWDTWKNLGSVGAVVISFAALLTTLRSTNAKTLREQREELKEMIEKLIDFRSELNMKYAAFKTEQEQEQFSSAWNVKKSIYLESSEYLARQLPHVTPAEWIVLGNEYMLESNFVKAEVLFQRSLASARKTSLITQVGAVRALAGAQMSQGGEGVERGRRSYQQATAMLIRQKDPYSLYTMAYTYRQWSYSEYSLGNYQEAHNRIKDALRVASLMPDWFAFKQFERRQCSSALLTLNDAFFRTRNPVACEETLTDALTAIDSLTDNFSRELRGRIYAREAFERSQGNNDANEHFVAEAKASVETLPPQTLGG